MKGCSDGVVEAGNGWRAVERLVYLTAVDLLVRAYPVFVSVRV